MTAPDRASFEAALNEVFGRVVTFGKVADVTPHIDAVVAIYDALCAERDAIAKVCDYVRVTTAQEIHALRAERDAAVVRFEDVVNDVNRPLEVLLRDLDRFRAEVATLTADNERLRAALTEISGHGCYRINATAGPVGDALDHLSECVHIACAALAPLETEAKP